MLGCSFRSRVAQHLGLRELTWAMRRGGRTRATSADPGGVGAGAGGIDHARLRTGGTAQTLVLRSQGASTLGTVRLPVGPRPPIGWVSRSCWPGPIRRAGPGDGIHHRPGFDDLRAEEGARDHIHGQRGRPMPWPLAPATCFPDFLGNGGAGARGARGRSRCGPTAASTHACGVSINGLPGGFWPTFCRPKLTGNNSLQQKPT